tara:strand:- start:44 stop:211 length:168 start_codon:yes stop_codon:yes gene_type:complete
MTDNEKIKNLQKALGVIRKGVVDFETAAQKRNEEERAKVSSEILNMVDRVIGIYA